MSSAACEVVLDTDVVGELEEFAVTSAMPTGKPASRMRPRGMQRITSSAEMSE